MLGELHTAVVDAADDPAVRAICLITGEGPTFCAGQDLSIFTGQFEGHAVREAIVKYYKPLIMAMVEICKSRSSAQSTVARPGPGPRWRLRATCVSWPTTPIFCRLSPTSGWCPTPAQPGLWRGLVGYSRALQLCIEAERIPAARCLDLGPLQPRRARRRTCSRHGAGLGAQPGAAAHAGGRLDQAGTVRGDDYDVGSFHPPGG